MSGAVISRKPSAVHAERDIQVLQSDVVNDHVIRALHEGAVDRKKGLQAACRHTAGEEGGMLLGDADIVAACGVALGKVDQARARRHGGCDGDNLVIVVREICELRAKQFRVSRGGGGGGLAGVLVEFSKSVKLVRPLQRGRVAFPFLSKDVQNDRLVLGF